MCVIYFNHLKDCEKQNTDFRAEQCAMYDDKLFSGQSYKWEPYVKGLFGFKIYLR